MNITWKWCIYLYHSFVIATKKWELFSLLQVSNKYICHPFKESTQKQTYRSHRIILESQARCFLAYISNCRHTYQSEIPKLKWLQYLSMWERTRKSSFCYDGVRSWSSTSEWRSTYAGKSHKPKILHSSCRFDDNSIISGMKLVAFFGLASTLQSRCFAIQCS